MKNDLVSSSGTISPKDNVPSSGFFGRIRRAWEDSAQYVSEAPPDEHESPSQEQSGMRRGESPYIGEIQIFAGNFVPAGWALCNGALLSISENEALFSLIGTTYGGDGQTTFALPDLRGRIPIHQGTGAGLSTYVLGQMGGEEHVTLLSSQLPAHTHQMKTGNIRGTGTQGVGLATGTVGNSITSPTASSVGGSQPHDNMPPYLGLNFIISLYGIYPSPS